MSEAFIFASINPQYDKIVHGITMNNLLSYCGLIDARISASEKDLPVQGKCWHTFREILDIWMKLKFLIVTLVLVFTLCKNF